MCEVGYTLLAVAAFVVLGNLLPFYPAMGVGILTCLWCLNRIGHCND